MAKNKGGDGGGGGGGGGNKRGGGTGVIATIEMSPEITNKDGKSLGEVASEAAVTGLVGVVAAVAMKLLSDVLSPLFGVKSGGENMVPKAALDKQQAYIRQLKEENERLKSGSSDDDSDD